MRPKTQRHGRSHGNVIATPHVHANHPHPAPQMPHRPTQPWYVAWQTPQVQRPTVAFASPQLGHSSVEDNARVARRTCRATPATLTTTMRTPRTTWSGKRRQNRTASHFVIARCCAAIDTLTRSHARSPADVTGVVAFGGLLIAMGPVCERALRGCLEADRLAWELPIWSS